ncbi:hypothetical protein [Mixta mediterraneensis]|uniref:hypothetical protein n=1 Tax=Mixta mediterraneensis TaxID=2758443 RepID=UPI0018772E70|nr:hypothetical protein [Mixta mediterraneensis]MBE5251750.1 hypothetical protein [Mixta mediterraneensis]
MMEPLGLSNWIAIIGVVIAVIGIITPHFLSVKSSVKTRFREAAAPLLEKLLDEIEAIEGGSYPFRKIRESELKKLLHLIPNRNRKKFQFAIDQYLEAHDIAITKHWHDENPSDGPVFFPASFVIKNPDEVLVKMSHLKKELSW